MSNLPGRPRNSAPREVVDYSGDEYGNEDYTEPDYAGQDHPLVRGDTSDVDSSDPYENNGDVDVFFASSDEVAAASHPEHVPVTFEEANPGEVYTRTDVTHPAKVAIQTQMWQLPANTTVGYQPVRIASPRGRRIQLLVWADASNGANPVGLSHDPNASLTPGGGAVGIGSTSVPIILHTTETLFIFNPSSTTPVICYTTQEYLSD